MYNFKPLEAEISAVNAGAAMRERQINELTNIPLEDESIPFRVLPFTQENIIVMPKEYMKDGCELFCFPVTDRPKIKGLDNIHSVKPYATVKNYYFVTSSQWMTPDDIIKELQLLVLPF